MSLLQTAAPARLYANDAAGAHAVVGGELQRATWGLADVVHALTRAKLNEGRRILERALPGGVLFERIERPYGSRALAVWMVLVPDCATHLHLIGVVFDARRRHGGATPWGARSLHILVTLHALARCGQRSVGRGDMLTLVPAIHPHVLVAEQFKAGERFEPGDEIQTIDHRGALLWRAESRQDGAVALVARTWLDGEGSRDPDLRRRVLLARANPDTIYVRRGTSSE